MAKTKAGGWGNSKGKNKNRKVAAAAAAKQAAEILAAGAAKHKRDARDDAGTSPKRRKHVER